jgi:hypothetical protein
MLISVRSTNGGGKSTVVRKVMEEAPSRKPLYGALGNRLPEAYKLSGYKQEAFLLGPYVTQCGGCDQLVYDTIIELINKYANLGTVIFEGVIVTSVYGRIGTLMERYKKDSVFIFLDTPLETCLQRIEARRGGKPRDERLIKNVTAKFKTAERIKKKIIEENIMRCFTVSGDEAPALIKRLLNGKA